MYFPLRVKVWAAFLTLFVTILTASLFVIQRTQTQQLEADVRGQFQSAHRVFNKILSLRKESLESSLSQLGADFGFKKAVATGDTATIESASGNLARRAGADVVWVADSEGVLRAEGRSDEKRPRIYRAGKALTSMPVVAKALNEESAAAIVTIQNRPYQIAAVPILAPDLIGVLVVGFGIEAMTQELKELTRCDVSFSVDGRLVASTLSPGRRQLLIEAAPALTPGETKVAGPVGRREIALSIPLAEGLTAFMQRSWEEAIEPLEHLRRLLFLVGAAGLFLTVLAGYLISRGVTGSIQKLAQATERLASGDYAVRVQIRQRDEIGKLGSAFNQMVAGLQEREKIRSVLQKAVSKEIADELLKRGEITLGGEERPVTVLFSDIREFTSLSERLGPQELVSQLNAYFSKMSAVIETHRGVIDKYVGDAIMALFGAPLKTDSDAANAVRASLAMTEALQVLNAERAKAGLSAWQSGVGLNTGPAVAGTMGSQDRWSYTVIGDAVNLASRLEGLTKHYGVRIIASRATKDAAGPGFVYRSLDLVRVKGKADAVEIFEVLGEAQNPPAWLRSFEEGIAAYRSGDFKAAHGAFLSCQKSSGGDKPSAEYLKRLEVLLASAPADWDPATTMLEK